MWSYGEAKQTIQSLAVPSSDILSLLRQVILLISPPQTLSSIEKNSLFPDMIGPNETQIFSMIMKRAQGLLVNMILAIAGEVRANLKINSAGI